MNKIGLVRIRDLKTHFFSLENVGKVMVLGCHDLSMFSNRNLKSTKGWRKDVKIKFRNLAQKEKPKYALHHPHTTVKVKTWLNAWNSLRSMLPSVEHCAGAGRYYEPNRERAEYDSLGYVLQTTKCESTNTIGFRVSKE